MTTTLLSTPRWIRRLLPLLGCAVALFGRLTATQAETTSYSGATEITAVPYTISTSGTYYLAADLAINADLAYAINITASNVTLDFNGHTLTQAYTTDNSTIGVYVGANNVTLRGGTLTGFLMGISLYGNNCLVEHQSVIGSTWIGMNICGSNNTTQHCRVNNTGGETVLNLAPYAHGILFQNGNNARILDCDVTTLTPGVGCSATCIEFNTISDVLVVNNRMGAANYGLGGQSVTGKYRDNLFSSNLTYATSFGGGNMIDAGNNN